MNRDRVARSDRGEPGHDGGSSRRVDAGPARRPGPGAPPVGNTLLGRILRQATVGAGGGPAPAGMDGALQALGSGTPVPNHALRSLEGGLGRSLGDVRLHSGTTASTLADQVGAEAFTVGQDVVLGRGAAHPDSPAGYHLLAHEVVHTLQPGGNGGASLIVGAADTPAEREAEAIATQLTSHRFGGSEGGPALGLDRAIRSARSGAGRQLRRFGRQEHQDLGDVTGEKIDLGGGSVLSWGEVVSLAGDEFESVNDLREMATKNPAELRRILSSDAIHSPQYVQLAMYNVRHFAGGGTATSTWQDHHAEALRVAILAGVHDSYPEYQDAMLIEAFGDHFLTDSFSAGHVRTPRAEIMAWYQDDFAPRALPVFIARVRARLRAGITGQLNSQMLMPRMLIDQMIDTVMGGALAYFDDEIRTQFQPLFGLGVSGAISGVLHDRDNERGLWVSSEAHPEPWLAYGDGRLVCSPTTAEQAEAAVLAARDELIKARALGETRHQATTPQPVPLSPFAAPGVVHFGFDSAALDPATTLALERVYDFLVARPELLLEITGHTDPLGADTYNDALALRRAQSIAEYLMAKGISPTRLHPVSAGEHRLLSTDRAGYASDRRAELVYQADGAAPDDLDWAQQLLAERFPGPPYPTIERYLPREEPGLNDPQEDWRWGTMTSQMAAELDTWIAHNVGAYRGQAASDARLNDVQVPVPDLGPLGIDVRLVTIRPRPLVLDLLDELIAHPTAFVGELVGIPAANRSVPALPPPVACP